MPAQFNVNLIFKAAKEGNLESLQSLLEQNPELIDAEDDNGCDILYYACQSKNLDLPKLLSEKYPNLLKHSRTLLHYACWSGNIHLVKRFDRESLKEEDESGHNCAYYSVKSLNYELIGKAFRMGFFSHKDSHGRIMYHYACEILDSEMLNNIFNDFSYHFRNWTIEYKDNNKRSYAYYLAKNMHSVNIIKNHKAHQNLLFKNTFTSFLLDILKYACELNNTNLIEYLLVEKSSLHAKNLDGANIFQIACLQGDFETVLYLSKNYPNIIENLDIQGRNSFHYACKGNNLDLVKYLLALKPEFISSQDNEGCNPFHYAYLGGKHETAQYLLEQKPELINSRNLKGYNHVHFQIIYANNNKEFKLLDNLHNYNLLRCACETGSIDVIKYLFENQSNLSKGENESILDIFLLACMKKQAKVVEYLLKKYSDALFQQIKAHNDYNKIIIDEYDDFDSTKKETHQLISTNIDVVNLIITNFADIDRLSLLRLLNRNPDFSQFDQKGLKIIHRIVETGDINLIKSCVEKLFLDLDEKDSRRNDVFSYTNDKEIIAYLNMQKERNENDKTKLESILANFKMSKFNNAANLQALFEAYAKPAKPAKPAKFKLFTWHHEQNKLLASQIAEIFKNNPYCKEEHYLNMINKKLAEHLEKYKINENGTFAAVLRRTRQILSLTLDKYEELPQLTLR